jgi:hypothetical protein
MRILFVKSRSETVTKVVLPFSEVRFGVHLRG